MLTDPQYTDILDKIARQCRDFISISKYPLYKSLEAIAPVRRVKVRKRDSGNTTFNRLFNSGFDKIYGGMRQRAVFTSGSKPKAKSYYMFPINGYQFMYNDTISDSATDLVPLFYKIQSTLGANTGSTVIEDFLKFAYKTDDVNAGAYSGAELIIYNIPYFFVVDAENISYHLLLNRLKHDD